MANKIKFHKRLSTISAPTTADDGVYFVKATGSTSFGIEVINNGVKATLDAVNATQARAALVTSTSATGVSNVATTNTNTYLNITQNGASPGSSTQITGAGTVTVTSDTAGKITITGSATSYSAGTTTLLNTGTDTVDRLWSASVLKSYYNNYLLRTGGSLSDSLKIANGTNTAGWQNNTASDANNYIQNNILALTTNNQGLHFFGDYTMNARRMGIQSSHASTGYANVPGILELNPFGGVVRIGSGGLNISGTLNFNNGSSIESQMADGSVKHFKNNVTNLYNNSVGGTYASYQTLTSRVTNFTGTTLTLTHKSGTTLTVNCTGTNTVVNKVFSIAGYIKINGEIPTAEVWTATPITSQGGNSSLKNYYDETTGYFECVHQYKSATGWLIHKAITTLVVGDVITLSNLTFVEDITPLDWQLGLLDLKYLIDNNYTAGNGLTLSGTTFSLPVTSSGTGNAVTSVTAGTNGLTVTKADTFLKKLEPSVGLLAVAYSHASLASASTQKSKLRITLPFKTNAGVMLGFTIRLYGTYRFMDIQCSGYLYSSPNNWLYPNATVSHDGGNNIGNNFDVTFGRDEDGYAYVTIPNFDYIGIAVLNVVRGYSNTGNASPIVATLDWTITQNEDTPNISLTVNTGIRESIPVATTTLKGLIKVGSNLSITSDGTLSSTNTNTTYTAGNGLTLTGTAFSLPVTTSGSGNAVTAVTQSTTGITITKGSTFSVDGHTHDSIIGKAWGSTSLDVNTDLVNTVASRVTWHSNLYHNTTNLFPNTNNANGILHLSTHQTDHWHQLGFSSNKNLYHRYQNGAWSQIITDKDTTRLNDSNHMNYYFSVSVNTASPLPFQDYDGTNLAAYDSNKTYPAFEVSMNDIATGTVTGTKYILYINSNTWEVIKIGNAPDTSSNHPVLFVDTDGVPKIKMASHTTKYPVACFVRRLNVSNNIFNVKRLFGLTFDSLLDIPSTLSGYGITNGMSTSHAANGVTSALITNWNTAYSNNHTHSNKAFLDVVNQNLGTTNTPTFANINTGIVNGNLGYNQNSLQTLTNGTFGGFLQTTTNGPINGTWYNIIKMLHNNTAGYYTELAQSFNGVEGLYYRRMNNGVLGSWQEVATTTSSKASLVTSTSATGVTNVATTNTNTYLNITQNGASPGSSTQVTGAGSVTVTSDTSGKITITGTNTTYYTGTVDMLTTGTDTTSRLWQVTTLNTYLDNVLSLNSSKKVTLFSSNMTDKNIIRVNLTEAGAVFSGYLKISVTSSYSNQNANGVIILEGGMGLNASGSTLWNNQLTCTLAQGNTVDVFYVDPVIKFETATRQPYIEIHKKYTNGNIVECIIEYNRVSPGIYTPTPSLIVTDVLTTTTLSNQQTINSGLTINGPDYEVLTLNRTTSNGVAINITNKDKTLGSLTYDTSNVFRVMSGSTEAIRADTSGIVSTAFKKSGSSSSYMLLGDGSHKLLSDFTDTAGTTWFTKSLSPVGSYISYVIPLFEYEPNIQNGAKGHINANFHFRRSNGLTGSTDNVRVIGGDAWESTPYVMFESTGTTLTLVSFTWNAKKYIGIRWIGGASHDRAIKGYGFAQDESIIQRISYANSNTGEVLNAEINSSITEYTPTTAKTNKLNYHQSIKTLTVDNSISFSQNDGSFIDHLGYTRLRFAAGGTVISSNSNSIYFRPSDTSTTQVTIDASANISATTFKKLGGTSSQFLKADGSVDATAYTTDAKARAALVTSTSATGVTNVATTNTNTYLNITQNGASPGSSTQVTGAGSVTVTSDTAGKITITGTDTNTTYSAGNGLTLSGTAFSLPVTDSGSGDYVTNVVASTNGLTVTKATLPVNSLITSSTATGVTNVATTNTNTYLNISRGGSSAGSSTQITGAGSVTVASDTAGKITITGNTAFSVITSKPTTLSGYGITDGMSTSHAANGVTSALITNWNTAYSNNHTHSNKTQLDAINQSLGTSNSPTFIKLNLTSTGTSWISGHLSNASILLSEQTSNSSYYSWMRQVFSDGSGVSIGTLGQTFYFSFATEPDLTAGNNNTTKVVSINKSGLTVIGSIAKSGGTSSQFLKADGSVDSNAYTTLTETQARAALVTSTSATGITNVATTNTNTYLNITQNGASPGSSTQVTGAGSVTVTSDTSGKITITGTNTNTTYTAGNGLTLSGTAFSLPVTDSGSGDYVTNVVASTNGLTVTKATLPVNALVTSTSATGVTNVATTNTNTYLNIVRGGTSTGSSTQVTGAGSVTVTSDANGKLTITGTDTNTTYSAGTLAEIEGNTTTTRIWAGSILNSKFAKYLPLAGGTATGTISAPSFVNTSLRKYKDNIQKFEGSGLELVESLEVTTFDRNDIEQNNVIGIIADDTREEFLNEEKDAVDLYKTIFIQAKAIQELSDKIKELTEIVNKLTNG